MSIVSIVVSLLYLALPVALVGGVVLLVRRYQSSHEMFDRTGGEQSIDTEQPDARVPATWERFLLYILSFAGLMVVLFAVSTLLALAVGLLLQHVTTLGTFISDQDARTQAASFLATLIVGMPLWLWCWRLVQRRVRRAPRERHALERRLFLATVFGVTSVVALFSLQGLLDAVLSLPGRVDQTATARDAVISGAQFLTYGVAWLLYARLGWRERTSRIVDIPHDLAVYTLAGFALAALAVGIGEAIHHAIMAVQGTAETFDPLVTSNVTWTTWGEVASLVVAGGAIWTGIWAYDLRRGGARILRVVYLYLVLAVAAPMTAVAAGGILFEFIRRAFSYEGFPNNWGFLVDWMPLLVVGAGLWIYHWIILRRQAAHFAGPEGVQDAIVWPRRPALAVFTLGGLATLSVSLLSLVWLAIDALLTTHGAIASGLWWCDQLSASLAGGIIGFLLWLPSWRLLQRAVATDPERESTTPERRWLLGAIVLGSALAGMIFAAATLYQIFRGILQTTDANTLADGLRYGSATVGALVLGSYHGVLFRRDLRRRVPAPAQLRVSALITPGSEHTLDELRQRSSGRIALAGYLAPESVGAVIGLDALCNQLAVLRSSSGVDGALLILRADGGRLYSYSRAGVHAPALLPLDKQVESRVAVS